MKHNITLHTFGDSHASKEHGGWDNSKMKLPISIRSNWLGPKLMYSFARDKNKLFDKSTVFEGDIVVFCFGEIDCRCHVGKYKPNWKKNIDSLVENYFLAIEANVSQYKDLTTMIFNVVPQIQREHPKNAWMLPYQKNAPHIGSDLERVEYTKYMNKKLSDYCKKYNYEFIDVYDCYADDQGFLIEELSDKNCHIADPLHVANFLIQKFWKK